MTLNWRARDSSDRTVKLGFTVSASTPAKRCRISSFAPAYLKRNPKYTYRNSALSASHCRAFESSTALLCSAYLATAEGIAPAWKDRSFKQYARITMSGEYRSALVLNVSTSCCVL